MGEANKIDLILTHTNRFDQHNIFACGVEHGGGVRGRARQPSKIAARGHAAYVDSWIGVVGLHAYAVAEDRTTGVRAGGINRNDANRPLLPPILAAHLTNHPALARARSPL